MKIKTKFFNIFRSIFKISFLEKWLRQKTKNKPVSNFWCKLAPNNYQYRNNSFRVFEYDGIMLKADIHDYVGHALYFGFEDKGHQVLYQLTKKDDIVLDIGTNIGSTLLGFANIVGKQGKVYGFEPDLFNFKQAQKNILLNNFKNVTVENIGLGNEKGSFKLYIDTESNRGGNRIKINEDENQKYTTISVERLDDWIFNKNITQLNLIKIDVEGFETNVIKGGLETIKQFKPKMFIELDDENLRNVGSNAKELIKILEALNYKINNAETNNIIHSSTNFTHCHYDIIATTK